MGFVKFSSQNCDDAIKCIDNIMEYVNSANSKLSSFCTYANGIVSKDYSDLGKDSSKTSNLNGDAVSMIVNNFSSAIAGAVEDALPQMLSKKLSVLSNFSRKNKTDVNLVVSNVKNILCKIKGAIEIFENTDISLEEALKKVEGLGNDFSISKEKYTYKDKDNVKHSVEVEVVKYKDSEGNEYTIAEMVNAFYTYTGTAMSGAVAYASANSNLSDSELDNLLNSSITNVGGNVDEYLQNGFFSVASKHGINAMGDAAGYSKDEYKNAYGPLVSDYSKYGKDLFDQTNGKNLSDMAVFAGVLGAYSLTDGIKPSTNQDNNVPSYNYNNQTQQNNQTNTNDKNKDKGNSPKTDKSKCEDCDKHIKEQKEEERKKIEQEKKRAELERQKKIDEENEVRHRMEREKEKEREIAELEERRKREQILREEVEEEKRRIQAEMEEQDRIAAEERKHQIELEEAAAAIALEEFVKVETEYKPSLDLEKIEILDVDKNLDIDDLARQKYEEISDEDLQLRRSEVVQEANDLFDAEDSTALKKKLAEYGYSEENINAISQDRELTIVALVQGDVKNQMAEEAAVIAKELGVENFESSYSVKEGEAKLSDLTDGTFETLTINMNSDSNVVNARKEFNIVKDEYAKIADETKEIIGEYRDSKQQLVTTKNDIQSSMSDSKNWSSDLKGLYKDGVNNAENAVIAKYGPKDSWSEEAKQAFDSLKTENKDKCVNLAKNNTEFWSNDAKNKYNESIKKYNDCCIKAEESVKRCDVAKESFLNAGKSYDNAKLEFFNSTKKMYGKQIVEQHRDVVNNEVVVENNVDVSKPVTVKDDDLLQGIVIDENGNVSIEE